MRVFDFNSAIVRAPGRSVVDGLRVDTSASISFDALLAEHGRYVAALRTAGLEVTELDALEQFPDSIFVEDPALVFSDAAVLLRPGAVTRRAESQALVPILEERFPKTLRFQDGFADGGDILVTPGQVYIGLSARTDRIGAAALKALLESIGLTSRIVEVPRGTLHLKTDCALIDEESILTTASLAQSGLFAGFRTLVVPDEERAVTNALRINDVLFVRAGFPRTLDMLVDLGFNVVPLPVAEIAKLDAGLSCMSLRWFDPMASSTVDNRAQTQ